MVRQSYKVYGKVQGVGFRPFVFQIAKNLGLTGIVQNTSEGVYIEAQGTQDILKKFEYILEHNYPEIAHVVAVTTDILEEKLGEETFFIAESTGSIKSSVLISPDIATCTLCKQEVFDVTNRRYRYPFTNCTACGPRYSIISNVPYDRSRTSMACFTMCSKCNKEYNDPLDRRFHAQPNACSVCGPNIWLNDRMGKELASGYDAIHKASLVLYEEKVLAIKGIGGFHLACNAFSSKAVIKLRHRKHRPHKPLAVMVPNIDVARKLAIVSQEAEKELLSPSAPIVILESIPGVLPEVSPDSSSIGIMLPYTPLHQLLLNKIVLIAESKDVLPALIMTSGNIHGEPIVYDNLDVVDLLEEIADVFLLHNRDIINPLDDSVIQIIDSFHEKSAVIRQVVRRARGYTPLPISIDALKITGPCVLALGAELKNTISLTRGKDVFLSQHIGEIQTPRGEVFFSKCIDSLRGLLHIDPEYVVCDLHPDYFSTRHALDLGLPILRMQHHFAHGYSVLAEHNYIDEALVLAIDGTGYGPDGTVWGGELLHIHPKKAKDEHTKQGTRIGRIGTFPLPGGSKAIKEPWRLVSGFLALPECIMFSHVAEQLWGTVDPQRLDTHTAIAELVHSGNGLETSSCGRLFDLVSALLGLCEYSTYEGQAAIRLEHYQDLHCVENIDFPLEEHNSLLELNTKEFILQLFLLHQQNVSKHVLARQFHLSIVEGLAELALAGACRTGIKTVVIAGGVLYNKTIAILLPEALRQRGLIPLMHINVPFGDGGISLGQAFWARMVLD